MRIGLSCTSIEPVISQHKIDGIGTYTQHLYESYLQQQKMVVPLSFPKHGLKTSHYSKGQIFSYSYIASTVASIFNLSPFSIHRVVEKQIDLFHATDHLIPQFKNTPIVATIHDAEMYKRHEWINKRHLQHLKSWGRKLSLNWVDHFITISHAMVPELVNDCGIPEEKISVIHNGISPWWFEMVPQDEKKETLAKFNLPEKFVLFTGTLNYRKNVLRLVQAYMGLPADIQNEYPLVIVGKAGWDNPEGALAIEQLEANRAGRWLNYVSDLELRALFQSASLYAHPSLHEGFGLTLLQAFASNTPVLTSDVAAMPEVADGAAHLIDPYSVEDIREGIKTLLTNITLRDHLIQKGAERVKQFSWEQCAQQTLALYAQII